MGIALLALAYLLILIGAVAVCTVIACWVVAEVRRNRDAAVITIALFVIALGVVLAFVSRVAMGTGAL